MFYYKIFSSFQVRYLLSGVYNISYDYVVLKTGNTEIRLSSQDTPIFPEIKSTTEVALLHYNES